jgi:hypothetical protein
MKKSIAEFEERKTRNALVNQQYAMTNINDLALILSESMEQMQQQMAQQMQGKQMCEKPGDNKPGGKGKPGQGKPGEGKPSLKGMPQQQQQLNEQMQQMQEQMKNGKNPSSKSFAKMAAKQAALRKALRKIQQQQKEKGKGSKTLKELIDGMNKIEEELVNKKLPSTMMKRQEEILTKLLEAEKAEREQGKEKKREAKSAIEKNKKLPPALEEYIKERNSQIKLYKAVSPLLTPFYKNKVENYFNNLN